MRDTIRGSLGSDYRQARSSGEGYEIFLPTHPQSAELLPVNTPRIVLFKEMGAVVERLLENRSLLVWGEPGEGKSHLRDDVTMAGAAANDIPFLMVSCHINGAKEKGPALVSERLKELRDAGEGSKLVVFDNLDYIGYKGKHRTRTRARDYAQRMEPIIEEVVNDESLLALGFIHDEEWRVHRWSWSDPEKPDDPFGTDSNIYTPAKKILDYFADRYEFEGWLTDYGLREVIEEAGGDEDLLAALDTSVSLKRFFYARHLDPKLFRENPELAIKQIRDRRSDMKRV